MNQAMKTLRTLLIVGLFVSGLCLPLCISIAADFMAPEHSCSVHTPEHCP